MAYGRIVKPKWSRHRQSGGRTGLYDDSKPNQYAKNKKLVDTNYGRCEPQLSDTSGLTFCIPNRAADVNTYPT